MAERGQRHKQGRMEVEGYQLYQRSQVTGQARDVEDELQRRNKGISIVTFYENENIIHRYEMCSSKIYNGVNNTIHFGMNATKIFVIIMWIQN